jgi:hypothetical protein
MTVVVEPAADETGEPHRTGVPPAPAPGTGPATARALAVTEARRLLRHPAFLAGVVVTVLLVALVGGEPAPDWPGWSMNIVLVFAPLGWFTIVATDLMALRDRRAGTSELIDTTPATPATRTVALALATLATIPVTVALLAGAGAYAMWRHDPIGAPVPRELAVALVLVVGGGVVGIAVARWVPRAIAGVAAVVVVIQLQIWMTRSTISPSRWLAFWVEPPAIGLLEVHPRPALWHLAWLLAWVAIMAVVAVARHGLHRPLLATVAAAVLVAALAGWAQTRPPTDAELAIAADLFNNPAEHQVCETHGTVTYCAYPDYRYVIGGWRGAVDGVLAAVPPAAQRPLEVRQRLATVIGDSMCDAQRSIDLLPPEVAARVDPSRIWIRDGEVHPGITAAEQGPCGGRDFAWMSTAISTGAWAVGLPPAPWGDAERCAADGEARSAVALWLGAQAVPGGADSLRSIREDNAILWSGRVDFARHWTEHPQWGVAWHIGDLDAALELLDRPAAEVRALVAEHWNLLTDPATTTLELRELAGASEGRPPRDPLSNCPDPPVR